jgi:hypothetical protein
VRVETSERISARLELAASMRRPWLSHTMRAVSGLSFAGQWGISGAATTWGAGAASAGVWGCLGIG